MFCTKCGAQIPDDSTFCSACGNAIKENATQPQAEPVAPVQPEKKTPVGKNKYFSKVAPSGQRIMRYIALILGLACMLTVFLARNKTIKGSIFEIPLLSMIGMDDAAEMKTELDKAIMEVKKTNDNGELEEFVEEILDVEILDLEAQSGMSMNKFLELFSPLSIENILELSDIFAAGSGPVKVFDTVVSIANGFMWALIVLTLLGVLFQKIWLMVLSFILSVPFVWLMGGVTYLVAAALLYIATAVLFSRLKSAYKGYCASCKAA